ncbi:molybdopterin molybdotransferase MoeA [Acinetobacter sp. MD2(2019)]|uniref:molybdopterin molybdotransferase MoeA n=1 Tax=Acinetobacter sp. MD2(2019) TaxID=2605273 RepID=UPI002D1E9E49|nr:molybdopterin molybdotransferase MoeA [Acinetobacter sp. MD2(2019)]MEB3754349.1 molybdopterin molybdotransferase MoeA [Acinetobacter sp. MD2(2019)]
MSCSGNGLISVDQALDAYRVVQPLKTKTVPLMQAHQHYLAADVVSDIALPLFTQSAVDGYALRSDDILAGVTEFELVGEVRAGIAENIQIQSGQCVRIFTGGRLPDSADTVARQEIMQVTPTKIVLNEPLNKGTDIRYQGEELQVGTPLAVRGQDLKSGVIAALSMAGVKQVQVFMQPKIAVLITGDEVSQSLDNDAQVFDANAPMILTWLKEQGFSNIHLEHVVDQREILTQALKNAFDHYDLVITTGGVSVGDYDLIRPVSMQLGATEVFWKVAQKPGKPLYFAQYQTETQQSYLLGLPGNPAAVFVCLSLHVTALLNALQGNTQGQPAWKQARLESEVKPDSRDQLLRMKLAVSHDGQLSVTKLAKQQSHMLSNLNQANVIVRIPMRHAAEATPEYVSFIEI